MLTKTIGEAVRTNSGLESSIKKWLLKIRVDLEVISKKISKEE